MCERRTCAGLLATAVFSAVPAGAAASCEDILDCASSCYDDDCVQQCMSEGDGAAQSAFYSLTSCLSSNCGYDSSGSCAETYCSYQLQLCASDGGDGGYSGQMVDDFADNFTLKIGGGYAFELDNGLGELDLGWEHLWISGPATSATSFQLGFDALIYFFGYQGGPLTAPGLAVDAKVYFGSDVSGDPAWFTFGLGAFAGGGGMWNGGDVSAAPYVIAAAEVSLQWLNWIGGGFDLYGGVLVAFLADTYVAPIVGARGVIDFALNTHDDEV